MIVVDASTLLEVLLNTPAASKVRSRLFTSGATLHAPHLIDVEVAQVLRRYVLARALDAARGQEALDDLEDFPLTRYPHGVLLPRVWELRNNVSAYDAVYIALAESLGATLLTRDSALSSVPDLVASVEIV
jgi:predicted nucleic acid-binding protein